MTSRGKLIFTILFLAIVGAGVAKWWPKIKPGADGKPGKNDGGGGAMLVETQTEVPRLNAAGAYASKDGIVDIELSEYIGYAGLIAANGGLEPNPDSIFAKKHGFKLRIKLSEESNWSTLNEGRIAASATTVDVLAVYGRQFNVTVPVQIAYSRGADGVVVNSGIKRVNDLKGKVLAAEQFTESDFFIRYLAQEAGIPVKMLASLDSDADPEAVNLVYAEDAFAACDAYTTDATGKIIGCVTWAPKTTETVQESGGKSTILTTNKNLLIVADILIVNKGFATAEPDKVKGLVAGILEGNEMVKKNPDAHYDIIAKALTAPNAKPEDKWDRAKVKADLQKVHLSNGPENLAFFGGAIDAAGSFAGIYQTAVYSYGTELLKNPVDSEYFAAPAHLKALEAAGAFAGQAISIQPIKTQGANVETDPILSKNIRFFFDANKKTLNPANEAENNKSIAAVKHMLQVSLGSKVLLIGHTDPSNVETFRQRGAEFLRTRAMEAVQLSKDRATEVRRVLIEREQIAPERLETMGKGWDEPVSKDPNKMELNRRVEAQWFTLE